MTRAYLSAVRVDPCAYCGSAADVLDHIDAKARGGEDDADNFTAACSRCNQSKGARTLLGFLLHHNRPLTRVQKMHRQFGVRLRRRRQELGLSQAELAMALETDTMNISRWERGYSGPRAESFLALARMLGRDPAWFYKSEEQAA